MVWLRWPIVAFWVAAATASVLFLPPLGQGGNDLSQLVSTGNPAVQSEIRSFDKFGFPLLSRVAVVQRNPGGLSQATLEKAVQRARAVTDGAYPDAKPIIAAVPIPNAQGLIPGSKETVTTVITFLFTAPDVDYEDQLAVAQRFAAAHYGADEGVVGVTGSVPARVEQGRIVQSSVPRLELVTIAAVFFIVAIAFRSLVAPMLALGTAGVAALLTLHVGGALAERMAVPVPQETQPLLVALLLGVVTDYVVFYLSGVRGQLARGEGRLEAARQATARFTPIVATAGATVAAGTGALLVADSPAFRAFGPGMALAVLIGMLVAVTLVPALLAILGGAALWSPRYGPRVQPEDVAAERSGGTWARMLTRRWVALPVLLIGVGVLVAAALPVRHMGLAMSFVEGLPPGHPARQAATQAQADFAEGVLSPTELLLQGNGIASRQSELTRLGQALAGVPGVDAVIGPGNDGNDAIPQTRDLFRARDGSAARYLLVLSDHPLGDRAINTVTRLRHDLPRLLQTAGLTGVTTSIGGDTAVAKAIVDQTTHDLGRIAVAALIANLLFLVLFLRALVVPIGLLACSVLAIGSTLGLTTWLFQDVLHGDGLTFYVPFAAAVLLVALGSDYNIFGVGPAWKEARTRSLREALAITLPQSARAIRAAAITLAVSLGLLATVPLRPFQELAFALSAGILIDAFIVRSLLAPALLTLMGSLADPPTVTPDDHGDPLSDETADEITDETVAQAAGGTAPRTA